MNILISPISKEDLSLFKSDMQDAFQKGFEERFGATQEQILPEKDIDESLNIDGSAAYKAVVDGNMVGGIIVAINPATQHNELHFLYVKNNCQGMGIGKKLWFEMERLYPLTKVWETCTPYFERRNIHFYVNVCKFKITEFINEKHPASTIPENFKGDGNEGMFILKKEIF